MDNSNGYWWMVKALKTREVGYVPAENIEMPFERLARLNNLSRNSGERAVSSSNVPMSSPSS